MLRFSANLGFLWPDRPLLDRIDAAAHAGFRAIEVHWPYEVPADALRAACDARGLTPLGLNTPRGDVGKGEFGLGALPGREADFGAAMDQSIAYCTAAGFRTIHAMAGIVPGGRKQAARAIFATNLETAADKAARNGLTLLLEPLNPRDAPGYYYSTVEEPQT